LLEQTVTQMHRSLLVAAALCCLPACELPNGPGQVQPPVTGEWSGTFESSWGVLPMKASLTNDQYLGSISGDFRIDGQRASGTVSGLLETKAYNVTMFWGELTISYRTASGEMCRSESPFAVTAGSASEKAVDFFAENFSGGNCPDPPTKAHITLRR